MTRHLVLALAIGIGLPAESIVGQEGPPFELVGPGFFALQVADDSVSADWYGRLFGFTPLRRIEAEDGSYSIRILERGEFFLEIISQVGRSTPPSRVRGIFKTGLHVDDIEAAHAWFNEHGADTDRQIFTDDWLQAKSFLIRDPDGNRVQLFQRCGEECG